MVTIRPAVAEMLREDEWAGGRTEMSKPIYAFSNSVNAAKHRIKLYTYFKLKRREVFTKKRDFLATENLTSLLFTAKLSGLTCS